MLGERACDEADLLPTKRRLTGANDESTRQKWRRFLAICAKNVVPDRNAAAASPDHAPQSRSAIHHADSCACNRNDRDATTTAFLAMTAHPPIPTPPLPIAASHKV